MSSSVSAAQFLYTSAPFGDQGYDGLQFVGLPAAAADRARSADLTPFVGYSAPADAPSSPDDETIRASFPVAFRMLCLQDAAVVLAARYGGQVYHHGRRGKWGNTFTHVLVMDAVDVVLAAVAQRVPWRTCLTAAEVEAGELLQMEDLVVDATPGAPTTAGTADDEALMAAILTRLQDGPMVVVPDAHHEELLRRFARAQANLPPAIRRGLSWSTYEADGGAGFDIVGTRGTTRLAADLEGYTLPGRTAVDPVFEWAARAIVADSDTFWREIEVLGGFEKRPNALRAAMAWCRTLSDGDAVDAAAATAVVDRLERLAPDSELVATARRWSRSLLDDGSDPDFTRGRADSSLAKRLAAWSGESDWGAAGARSAANDPRLEACFADPPDGAPLADALSDALARCMTGDEVSQLAVEAVADRVAGVAPIAAFVAVLDRFLGTAPNRGLAGAPQLLHSVTSERSLWRLAEALIRAEAMRVGADAIGRLLTAVGQSAPSFVAERGRELEVDGIASLTAGGAGEIAWSLGVLGNIRADEWRGPLASVQPRHLLSTIDACIGRLPRDRVAPARRLAEIWLAWFRGDPNESLEPVANTWCVLCTDAPRDAVTVQLVATQGEFPSAGVMLRQRAEQMVYEPFVAARFRNLDQGSPEVVRSTFIEHWREDVAAVLDEHAQRTVLSLCKRSPQAIGFVTKELTAVETDDLVQQRWRAILWDAALSLADTLDDAGFRALTVGLPPDWVSRLTRKRKQSVRGLGRALGAGLRGLVFGKTSRRREVE